MDKDDYFHYPKPTEFRAVVERFGFPDPSRWRHQFATIHKSNGVTYRLTVKGIEFPGRCFHCKRNNKSASFCFFGQGARDGRDANDLPRHMVSKLEKIAVCVRLRDADAEDGETFVFPHESEYQDMKSRVALDRVSEQHGFPPVVALLCQPSPWRFREFFPASLFDDFVRARVEWTGANAWREPDESLEERRRVHAEVTALEDDDERRKGVANLMRQTYLVFRGFDCSEECRTPSRECAACRRVRGRAKKYYLDEVGRIVSKHVGDAFERREGAFSGCPRGMSIACHEDDACQVDRLVVGAREEKISSASKKRRREGATRPSRTRA